MGTGQMLMVYGALLALTSGNYGLEDILHSTIQLSTSTLGLLTKGSLRRWPNLRN